MMEPKTQTGYLVLADISGFTSFVAQTEIDHAHLALSFLLETIMEKLSSLLTIFQLEGDAVFAYVEESQLQEGKSLLGLTLQPKTPAKEERREVNGSGAPPNGKLTQEAKDRIYEDLEKKYTGSRLSQEFAAALSKAKLGA